MSLARLLGTDMRKLAAWNKAEAIQGYNPTAHRKDRFGNWISFNEYGQTSSYGWEIDHIHPLSLGGSNQPKNEVATHWKANRVKSNHFVG
jgi:5-methylcytosine-specific restriction endonuclease McrA